MDSKNLSQGEIEQLILVTQKLLQFDTINPPGNERKCARFIGDFLRAKNFQVDYYEFAKNRTSLIARLPGRKPDNPLTFSGHIDTVPLGKKQWQYLPLAGEIDGDKIYGRGASDMKGAIAAMLIVAECIARIDSREYEIALVITAGEERGCAGAKYLAGQENILPQGGALLIGEPTSNFPFLGHKGTMWLEIECIGQTAHGSMPHLGDNAIYKAIDAIQILRNFQFDEMHPLLGKPTMNIGTIRGGQNINSVPDRAQFTVDIRTIFQQDHDALRQKFKDLLGDNCQIKVVIDAPAVATDIKNSWVQETLKRIENKRQTAIVPAAAPYFTDAGALVPAMAHPQTIILGPGEPEQAHVTDEYCFVSKLIAAAELYDDIARAWLGID